MRTNIILECKETRECLYLTSKNKRNTPEALKLMKYSPRLKQRALFVEVRK
ncbi:MAG: 50S ribosomal protein L33 [Liquorilactobacillus hordei]|uniref:50S ribosomal protein L33 n=1 Tax=Liquorilactobacillus hordei TaxID=468911 RepID=UPI0039E7D7FF